MGVKEDKDTYGIVLELDTGKVVSDSSNYFIGKTNNYVFFYHEKDKTTEVFPINRIRQFTFTGRRKRF